MNDDRTPEFLKASEFHEYDFSGNLIKFKTKTADLLVTPNHRMIYRSKKTDQLKFERADVLMKKSEFSVPTHLPLRNVKKNDEFFIIPESKSKSGNISYPEIKIPYKLWIKFIGIYLSEGSCDKEGNKNNHGNERYRVTISQSIDKNPENCKKIEDLLTSIGFKFIYSGGNFEINNKPLCLYLRNLGNSNSKFIPDDIKNQSTEYLEFLWEWLCMGDGYIAKNGTEMYWTSSKKLASDVQDVLARMGFNSGSTICKKKTSVIKGRVITSENIKDCYRIVKYRKHNTQFKSSLGHFGEEFYEGKVYCLTVPNGRLFIKRNGFTCWSGNSLGVVTCNLPRLAYLSKTKEEFLEKVSELFDVTARINNAKRSLIKKRIELGAAPLYTLGFIKYL